MTAFIHDEGGEPLRSVGEDASGMQEGVVLPSGSTASRDGGRWAVAAIVLVLLVAVLAGLAYYAGEWKKSVWVKRIVITGNRLLSTDELMKKAGGLEGRSLESVDSAALTRSYRSLPYVRDVNVSRELNGVVRIVVEERLPLTRIASGRKVQVIDSEGYILPYRKLSPPAATRPLVSGVRTIRSRSGRPEKADKKSFAVLKGMIDAVSASEYAGLIIRHIALQESNPTYFTAAGSSTRFIVGNDGNYKEKLKKFEIFWQKVVARKGLDSYATVDLRFDDRVFAVERDR